MLSNKIYINLIDNHSDAHNGLSDDWVSHRAWYFNVENRQKPEETEDGERETEETEEAVRSLDGYNGQVANLYPEEVERLQRLSNTIDDLIDANNNKVLIFPRDLDYYNDGIQKEKILSIAQNGDGNRIDTGCIMGYIGIHNNESNNDLLVRIRSRFDTDYRKVEVEETSSKKGKNENREKTEKEKKSTGKDYFMHYLLQKVMCINLTSLSFTFDNEDDIFDFYYYLFPGLLKRAMKQGLFKMYVHQAFNDTRVKGPLDITRHIKKNIPFNGKVAYTAREHSYDNPITELIRHAIEEIKMQPEGRTILNVDKEIRIAVKLIENCTPSYRAKDRMFILQQNLIKNIRHPFYTEYETLRKLCLQILMHNRLKFSETPDTSKNESIYGILFDGAWLWEEYIASVFSKAATDPSFCDGFQTVIHPQNKKKADPVYVFQNNSVKRYPDYYTQDQKCVFDAKYKHIKLSSVFDDIDRNDMNQMLTYMYILNDECNTGVFIFPFHELDTDLREGGDSKFTLQVEGRGGSISKLGFKIAAETTSMDFKQYCKEMEKNEKEFVNNLKQIIEDNH